MSLKFRHLATLALAFMVMAGTLSNGLPVVKAQGAKPDAKTLVVGQTVDVKTLDPTPTTSRAEANVLQHMFATLFSVSDEGKVEPYLAESATVSENGKEVTIKMKPGLTCSNGEVLNAEDAVYTFERTYNPDNKFTGNVQFVANAIGYECVELVDEMTLKVKVKDRSPIVLGLLAEIYILCKDHYSKISLEEAAKNPVSSGAYKFVEQKPDDYLLMERVPTFTLRSPSFDRIYWRVIPEASTRVAELLAGNVDIIVNVPVDQIEVVNKSDKAKVSPVAGTRRMYVGFNQKEKYAETEGGKAIRNAAVRVALQYAVDVPTICESLLGTTCNRASSMVNPPNDNPDLKAYPYDPKKAEELLDAAGYPRKDGGVRFEITLQGPRGRYLNDASVVQAIGQYLTDVGVKTNVEIIDWAQYSPLARTHDVGPMFFLGTGGSTWSAWYDMADLSVPGAGGATNYTEWDGAGGKWFDLRKQFAETTDEKKQREIINEMLKVMYEDSPWLFLYFQPDFYGVSNRIAWTPRRDEKVFIYLAKPAQ